MYNGINSLTTRDVNNSMLAMVNRYNLCIFILTKVTYLNTHTHTHTHREKSGGRAERERKHSKGYMTSTLCT